MTTHQLPLQRLATDAVRRATLFIWLIFAMLALPAFAQQRAGEIQHLQGMATAQAAGGAVRFLGRGDPVNAGETITTTEKGFAVLSFTDGSKITLRPATAFAIEKYAHDAGSEFALLRLLKGGLRAVTGLINKRNPGSVEFRTITATIGIRGTSFDARICGDDCRLENKAAEGRPNPPVAGPAPDSVVARVVKVTGDASAVQVGKPLRRLEDGSPLYLGDEVKTGPEGIAVIGFRDQTRLALNPQTVFRINSFSYNRTKEPDNFALQLLKGGLRVFTGLIAKKDPRLVSVQTKTATLGIRGTGLDISCEGPCVDASLDATVGVPPTKGNADRPDRPDRPDGLFMRTWLGATFIQVTANTVDVELERVGFVGVDGGARLLGVMPEFMLSFLSPRPDQVDIDWNNLFGTQTSSGADGLYLYVRDGHVSLATALGRSDFGVGETGFIGADNRPVRLDAVPRFISDDPFPIPELFSQSDVRILQLYGATLGQPGQEICRL